MSHFYFGLDNISISSPGITALWKPLLNPAVKVATPTGPGRWKPSAGTVNITYVTLKLSGPKQVFLWHNLTIWIPGDSPWPVPPKPSSFKNSAADANLVAPRCPGSVSSCLHWAPWVARWWWTGPLRCTWRDGRPGNSAKGVFSWWKLGVPHTNEEPNVVIINMYYWKESVQIMFAAVVSPIQLYINWYHLSTQLKLTYEVPKLS